MQERGVIIKKVLQVLGSLDLGGLELVATSYQKYMDASEFQFVYLVYGNKRGKLEAEVESRGGIILRVKGPYKNFRLFYNNVRQIMKEYGPFDIVHSHTFFNSGLIMKAAYKENIPKRIAHSHSVKRKNVSNFKKIYNKIMRKYLQRYATSHIACSDDAGKYLFGHHFYQKHGTTIINGIDLKKYEFNQGVREKVRNQYNLNKSIVIGHTGSLNNVKNQTFLLDILKELTGFNYDFRLLLLGDGHIKEELLSKASRLGIEDKAIFLGNKENVSDFLMAMDIFIFPSIHEGLGIALIEAQAAGLPCIISDTIPKEAVISKRTSRLALNTDFNEWIDTILKIVNDYPIREERVSSENYSINSMISKIYNLYDE